MMAGHAHGVGGPQGSSIVEVLAEDATRQVRQTVSGHVRVGIWTETVDEVLRQDLESTRAEVLRVPCDRTLDPDEAPPVIRTEGAVTIVPVARRRQQAVFERLEEISDAVPRNSETE